MPPPTRQAKRGQQAARSAPALLPVRMAASRSMTAISPASANRSAIGQRDRRRRSPSRRRRRAGRSGRPGGRCWGRSRPHPDAVLLQVELDVVRRGVAVVEDRGRQHRVGPGLERLADVLGRSRHRPRRSPARGPPAPPRRSAPGRSRSACRRGPRRSAAPRPRRAARPRAPTRSRRCPVPSRPPLTSTSKRPSRFAASIAITQHCRPNRSAISVRSSGRSTAAVLTETLSAPASSRCQASSTVAHAAADGERDRQHLAHPPHRLVLVPAALGRGRDVEDDDLVAARVLVEPAPARPGRRHRAGPGTHALDDAAVADVEAGDDARGQHQPSSRNRDSSASP